MKCFNCNVENALTTWCAVQVDCVSSSCSETSGRECPSCGQSVGHTWLDGQPEWRQSEFYKP